jgi:hypothetical protein
MTSTAISAQGSTLQISTGTGGAKTLSSITTANPTGFASTAHGLNAGDVGVIAGFSGANAGAINGQTASVIFPTTNTFAVGANTQGLTITGTGTFTPSTYTKIGNLKTFSGLDGQASDIDITNLDSTAKEFIPGLIDNGGFSFEMDWDGVDAGQVAALAAQTASATKNWKFTLPNGKVASFAGYVKQTPISGGVDQSVKRSMTLKISGPVTWA